jgi:hypothetical protein
MIMLSKAKKIRTNIMKMLSKPFKSHTENLKKSVNLKNSGKHEEKEPKQRKL